MPEKTDVPQGTLALMILKTIELPGPLHGYRVARCIGQISGGLLAGNQGTWYPLLLKLEQEGATASGRDQTAAIIARFFAIKGADLS